MKVIKYPVLQLFIKLAIIEVIIIAAITIWINPDSSSGLVELIIAFFIFGCNSIVAIVFFFLHKDIKWKAWLLNAFVSPLYIGVLFEVWIRSNLKF